MEEIKDIIDEELNKIEPKLTDIYNNSQDITIKDKIEALNKATSNVERRNDLLGVLKRLKELGYEVDYNESMSLEELEELVNNVEM